MKNRYLVVIGCETTGEGYCDIFDETVIREIEDNWEGNYEYYLEEIGCHNYHYQVVTSLLKHDDIYTYGVLFDRLYKHDFPKENRLDEKS